MAPDTAYHFLGREAEDISQLETHSVEMKGEKEKREYDITCFHFQHRDRLQDRHQSLWEPVT